MEVAPFLVLVGATFAAAMSLVTLILALVDDMLE